MGHSFVQYFVAWFTVIAVVTLLIVTLLDLTADIGHWLNRHRPGDSYNEFLIQQLYAENVNVNRGDPAAPDYGATHNAAQLIERHRR